MRDCEGSVVNYEGSHLLGTMRDHRGTMGISRGHRRSLGNFEGSHLLGTLRDLLGTIGISGGLRGISGYLWGSRGNQEESLGN